MRVEDSQNVYHTLFEKINLEPLEQMGGIDAYQSVDVLSEATPNQRVTASVSVFLERLKQVSPKVERLDRALLDEHIASIDAQISSQLDEVMHHPDFQRV